MDSLTKITDVSGKYGVSARALRYYEDMGLIQSVRNGDYAYRLYDERAVKRLEQILILRKLNVGIKDIKRVFDTSGSEAVLEVLGKKVADIDEEVSLLHELKEIIIAFIRQIESADFSKTSDVKLLYEKARDIETRLTGAEYSGNPAPANRLFEIAGKLEEKAVSKLSIPDNALRRLLENVYFIFGDGIEAANELGRRHNLYVYHTCDHRRKHFQNADPRFQPGLCEYEENIPDFFMQRPGDAMRREKGIVRDYTPMVILDLIQLAGSHDGVICENDMDIESIIQIATHAVMVTNRAGLDDFIKRYEQGINSRDIPRAEKESLIRELHEVWDGGKPENPRETNIFGIKEICSEGVDVLRVADEIEKYFGLKN